MQRRDCDCESCVALMAKQGGNKNTNATNNKNNNNNNNNKSNNNNNNNNNQQPIVPPGHILGSDGKIRKDRDAHPYGRGAVILCKYKPPGHSDYEKGEARLADVVERREVDYDEDGDEDAWEDLPDGTRKRRTYWSYYLHFHDFNRRMDQWVDARSGAIVGPPSVGKAKHNEVKRKAAEEEKQKRLEREKLERERLSAMVAEEEANADGEPTVRRSSRAISRHGSDFDSDDSDCVRPSPSHRQQELELQRQEQQQSSNNRGQLDNKKSRSLLGSVNIGSGGVATVEATVLDEHEGMDEDSLREHEEVTKVKNVGSIVIGCYSIETWYFSPYPKEIIGQYTEKLYLCEYTFSFFTTKAALLHFQQSKCLKYQCPPHPPGNEIYRDGNLSMFEVDGSEAHSYCQNLCYMAKLFLDHKTLYYDVDPFLFYVLCEVDDMGAHPVGYYSKEKYSEVGYNLACILTFPCHQRKGYGRFLIAFSYLLSRREEKVGSPEKPMSDLGQAAYIPFWKTAIVDYLRKAEENKVDEVSIMKISVDTSIMAEDVIFSLNQLGLLKILNGTYFIDADSKEIAELAKKHPVKKSMIMHDEKLSWTPYVCEEIVKLKRDKFSIHNKTGMAGEEGSRVRSVNADFNGRTNNNN